MPAIRAVYWLTSLAPWVRVCTCLCQPPPPSLELATLLTMSHSFMSLFHLS